MWVMDEVDKLLAELQAEQPQQKQVERSPAPSPAPGQNPASAPRSLDELLGQLGEDTRRSVRTELSKQPTPPKPPSTSSSSPPISLQTFGERLSAPGMQQTPEKSLLADLKAHYQERDQAEALKRQQELRQQEQQRQQQKRDKERQEREKQHRLEVLRKQRRAELAEKAKNWLKHLNPRSEEGRWFYEFACGYESRLEAAIDYLEALQSVGQKLE
jgi:hypothetical protein